MINYVRGLAWIMAGCLSLTSWGMSSPREDLALVVIPERYSVIQVAFDLADQRPVVLVSYRGGDETDPDLYVWNGKEWTGISLTEFSEASFLKIAPRRVILVGDEALLPKVLAEEASWASQVWQVPSTRTDDLVNSFGKIFKFRKSEWNWFSNRYKLDLEDLNEDLRKDSWYYHPYIEDQPGSSPAPENLQKIEPIPEAPDVEDIPVDLPETFSPAKPDIEPIEDVQLPK